MPFEPGHKHAPGGARDGAGRKPDELRKELQEIFEKACPRSEREAIIEMISHRARAGEVKAAVFLFDRFYGKADGSDVSEMFRSMQTFMDTVTAILVEEVDEPTRERILDRLQRARSV